MEAHKLYGDRLKEARESLGLSIDDVSYELKINVKTLKKMEDSKTDDLPKAAFTRGFIKTYCTFLKISSPLVIGEYEQTLSDVDKKISVKFLQEDSEPKDFFVSDFLKDQLFPILIFAFVLFAAAILYSVLGSYKPNQTALVEPDLIEVSAPIAKVEAPAVKVLNKDPFPQENQDLTVKAGEEEGVEIEEVSVKAKELKIASVIQEDTKKNTADDSEKSEVKSEEENPVAESVKPIKKQVVKGEHKLVVEPLAKTALYIKTNSDSRPVRATLRPDNLRTFQFDSAEVRFLDAGAVSLIFDGEDIGALGVFGEEKKIEFPSLKEL